jgi:hypothetical protein
VIGNPGISDRIRSEQVIGFDRNPHPLAQTGFTPLDGTRYPRRADLDRQVVSLVAYHSCARIEADVRGLGPRMLGYSPPAGMFLTDTLLYCDMTTGPDGDYVRRGDRLAEIPPTIRPRLEVSRFVELATSKILAAAGRVEIMLQGAYCAVARP